VPVVPQVAAHEAGGVKRAVSFRLDAELLDRMAARAGELGQTQTLFVERALEQALDGHAVARREAPGDATREVGPEKAPRSPERVPAPARAHDYVPMHARSFNGHRAGCGCLRCDDVRTGRRNDAGEV
jgi:predicted transcriptional regulator